MTSSYASIWNILWKVMNIAPILWENVKRDTLYVSINVLFFLRMSYLSIYTTLPHYLMPPSSPISPPTKFITSYNIIIVTHIYTHMCTRVYAHMHAQLLSIFSSFIIDYIFMYLGWLFGIGQSMQELSPEGKWLHF